jgi:hypothetical protein
MISTRSAGLLIDTLVCLTLAKWETVSGRFGGYFRIQKQVAPDSAPIIPIAPQVPYVLAMCEAIGGLVSSFVTGAGISFVSKWFYGGGNWARTILIGTITGTLLESVLDAGTAPRSLPVHVGSLLPLFLVRQCSVAASIGYGLTARNNRD